MVNLDAIEQRPEPLALRFEHRLPLRVIVNELDRRVTFTGARQVFSRCGTTRHDPTLHDTHDTTNTHETPETTRPDTTNTPDTH